MGLYIKGMEMPKDDVHAFKQITITNNWIDGEVIMLAHDTITNEFIGEVVEVPEPHGRLIDEDDVIGAVHDRLHELQTHEVFRRKHGEVDLFGVFPYIAKIKTVIEAEGE